jgi:[acyl-carrier-protein] S-malonyltransferase
VSREVSPNPGSRRGRATRRGVERSDSFTVLTFLFPGQGSQKQEMGDAWTTHPSWEIVQLVSNSTSIDVGSLLVDADQATLTETNNAQLATFTMSMIVLDALTRIGLAPSMVAGHSLGEYSALVAAGVLGVDDGARLVAARGNAMRQAADAQDATMWAVLGLDDELVQAACAEADGDVWVANYNSPGQVIIAGAPDALQRAGDAAKARGAKRAMPIPVGGAFHTPLMAPALPALAAALEATEFRDNELGIVTNVDAIYRGPASGSDWRALLAAQLQSPVMWRQSCAALADAGATLFVEVGPGNVLGALAKRCTPETPALSVATPADLHQFIEDVTHHRLTMTNPSSPSVEATTHHKITVSPATTKDSVVTTSNSTNATAAPHGEPLFMTERLIVSPAAGLFEPHSISVDSESAGEIHVGSVLGVVAGTEVRSPFRGQLMGMLAMPGERVTVGQPIAWLRTASL